MGIYDFRKFRMNPCECPGSCRNCQDIDPQIASLTSKLAAQDAKAAAANADLARHEKEVQFLRQLIADLKSIQSTGLCQAHKRAKKDE